MKRLIAVPVAIAALAVPAAADAGLDASATDAVAAKGGVKPFKITFDVFRQGNKPVGVDNFSVKRLKITCDQGDFLLNFTLNVPGSSFFPVNDDRFNAAASNANSSARIRGTFVTNHKVRGKVRASGSFDGPDADPNLDLTNCNGARRYTAR